MRNSYSQFKIFFFDLDGTLLDSNKNISHENLFAVRKLQENGNAVCIASGRSAFNNSLIHAHQILHPDPKYRQKQNYLIVLNGAEIIDLKNDSIIYDNFLDKVHGEKLLKFMQDAGWLTIIYTGAGTTVNKKNPLAKSIISKEISQDVFYSKESNLGYPIKKITAHILLKFDEKVAELVEKFGDHIEVVKHGTRKFYQVVEINANNVSKLTAAQKVTSYYDLTLKNAVSFGDSFNDLKLLINSGYSISFADALPQIKKEVSFISGACDDSGVASGIEHVRKMPPTAANQKKNFK